MRRRGCLKERGRKAAPDERRLAPRTTPLAEPSPRPPARAPRKATQAPKPRGILTCRSQAHYTPVPEAQGSGTPSREPGPGPSAAAGVPLSPAQAGMDRLLPGLPPIGATGRGAASVVLRIVVAADGRVLQAGIVNSSGSPAPARRCHPYDPAALSVGRLDTKTYAAAWAPRASGTQSVASYAAMGSGPAYSPATGSHAQ